MTRTIKNEQRRKLWNIVDSTEPLIGDIQSLTVCLNRVAQCAEGQADGDAIYVLANAISERARQLSEAQSKLFDGLCRDPEGRAANLAKFKAASS